MANICENEMRVYSENPNNLTYVKKYFDEWHSAEIVEIDDDTLNIFFDSKWDFPLTAMEEMVEEIPDKEHIDLECLSVEWGNWYTCFHVYQGDEWRAY